MIEAVRPPFYAITALVFAVAGWGAAVAQNEPGPSVLGSAGQSVLPESLDPNAPAASRRVTHRVDFDPVPGASSPIPLNWIRAQHDPPNRVRPGFPIWNRGELDPSVAFSGTGSMRLDIEGGSSSLLLDPGVIQIFPDADYAVVARVRTDAIEHARARLVARLLDRTGTMIPGSEVSSAPLRTAGKWMPISVRVPGDYSASTSLQIELLFEQPGPDPKHPYRPFEIERQDYQGSAWFDELAVIQVPRVEVWLDQPGNLVPGAQAPSAGVFVRDLVNEPLKIVYELFDERGRTVARKMTDFSGGRLETTWSPAIDRFGWYRTAVSVMRQGESIGSAQTAFIWAPPSDRVGRRVSARSGSPFSLSVARVPDRGIDEFGQLARAAAIPRVLTSLYDGGAPVTPERLNLLSDLAARLAREGSEVGLAIDRLPPEVSSISGPTPVIRAMADGDADGASWLEPILVDLGHRIRWWRAGAFDETVDGLAIEAAQPAIARLRDLVPGAMLELPWSSFDAIVPGAVRTGMVIAQTVDPSIVADEIPSLLSGFAGIAEATGASGWEQPEHTAVFRVAEGGDQRALIDEAVLGAAHAWVGFDRNGAGPARGRSLRLDQGWSWQDGRRPHLVPAPAAAAWLVLADQLRDRRAEVLPRVAPGVSGVLLTPVRTAGEGIGPVAIFWAEPMPEPVESLTLLLGPDPVTTLDVFGNAETVEALTLENSSVRAHRIDLRHGPVYVKDVDAELLRFLASVHLDPGRVQSNTEPLAAHLSMTNTWASALQGEFFIVEPGGLSTGTRATRDRRWEISPRFGSVATGAGDTERVPVEFDVSPAVSAGETPMVVDIDLSSPTVSDFVRIERTIEVGLEHIRMHLVVSYEPDPNGNDIVVYAIVENSGEVSQNILLKVDADGYSPQRASSTPALPGRRVIKAFPFRDGRALLAGQEVTVGLTIRENGSRLRQSVRIDDGF